jgi:aminomethyltransferase
VDDLIIYKYSTTKYLMVVNAGNIDKDWAWVNKIAEEKFHDADLKLENASERYGQLAVQGPKATELLQLLTDADLKSIDYDTIQET